MAHECPDCGELCYCGSDCDDSMNNFEKDLIACTHWKKCEREINEEDEE